MDKSPSFKMNLISISSRSRMRPNAPNSISFLKASGACSSNDLPRGSLVKNNASTISPEVSECDACGTNRPLICAVPVWLSTNWITPAPLTPSPTGIAMSCTTNPSPASGGAPFACRNSRAVVPSQDRAMERNTSANCSPTSCGNAASISCSYVVRIRFSPSNDG